MSIKLRNEVPSEKKWTLEDIIPDENLVPSMLEKSSALLDELTGYKGKLDEFNLVSYLKKQDELSLILEKIYVYASMRSDEDKSNSRYIEFRETAQTLLVEMSSALSFFTPELSAFSEETLNKLKNDPVYRDYSMLIDEIIRGKEHILSEKEEKILSDMSIFSSDFREIFSIFDNADLTFGTVKADGEEIPLTHGSYSMLLQNRSQSIRETAFKKLYAKYKEFTNTLSANYSGNVKKNVFAAKTRGFSSALAKALYNENIDIKVYENLLKVLEKNLPPLHRYIALRKKALGLKENHMYDLYVPLTNQSDKKYSYDKAYSVMEAALKPLGEEYLGILKEAKQGGWIDVEETKGKRSGAYSWGTYGVHPYVLLNHKGTLNDVFTLAHEMGHAVHSFYSNKTQPYSKASYEIFVAEIASTVNEVLLLKHLLKDCTSEDRKHLLGYYTDMFRTTVFRQTMFAEFEKFAHESVEQGQPLSSDRLCEHYYALNRKYYGEGVIHDEEIKYEWSRIPHFYNAFYVYKYSTGLICAVNIVKKLLSEEGFRDKYKEFLCSGGSDYPLNILKATVGIDLSQETAFETAMAEFNSTIEALEKEFE